MLSCMHAMPYLTCWFFSYIKKKTSSLPRTHLSSPVPHWDLPLFSFFFSFENCLGQAESLEPVSGYKSTFPPDCLLFLSFFFRFVFLTFNMVPDMLNKCLLDFSIFIDIQSGNWNVFRMYHHTFFPPPHRRIQVKKMLQLWTRYYLLEL